MNFSIKRDIRYLYASAFSDFAIYKCLIFLDFGKAVGALQNRDFFFEMADNCETLFQTGKKFEPSTLFIAKVPSPRAEISAVSHLSYHTNSRLETRARFC